MAGVSVRNLTKRYGQAIAANRVNLEAPQGQFLTLLGPSGCGKTTVLRCVAGLIMPDSGEVRIGDQTVFETASGELVPTERRGIGMVFQSYAIWPHLTVHENVAFGLKVRKVPTNEISARVRRALEIVRMAAYQDRYPSQLSGGQQQRVVLARCLAYEPTVLLLDEPLANLDAALREEMRHELRAIQRHTGTTVIAVTHDQAEALAMSDHIAVMKDGAVLQYGSPEEIYHSPRHPFVARFLGAPNVLPGEATGDGLLVDGVGLVRSSQAVPVGERRWLLLRPHLIQLLSPSEEGPNRLRGEVIRYTFLGDWREYEVQVGSAVLTVRRPTYEPAFGVREPVTVELTSESQVLFGEEGLL